MNSKRKLPRKLAMHRSFSRLAAKAERAGNYTQAGHYRRVAQRFLDSYHRDKEAIDRMKERRAS